MTVQRLRDIDTADRAQLLRVAVYFGPAFFTIVSFLSYFLLRQGVISQGMFVALLLLNVPLTVAGIFAIHRTVGAASTGLVRTIFAAGDIPPPRSYPRQDVLIARGQYAEAAEYFRDHLRVEPEDVEARFRLAELLETRLAAYDEAERLYLEVRRLKPAPPPQAEMRAANGLIDLYRKTGRRDRLKVELARFAERYRGSGAGEAAAREVRALKAADLTSESPRSPT